jgi:hypothetical protein
VQLTLTGTSILKKSEQKIYTLARMTSAEELVGTFVFSEPREVSQLESKTSALSVAETSAGTDDDTREPDGQGTTQRGASSDSSFRNGNDIERGEVEMLAPNASSKAATILPFKSSQRIEKPLPGAATRNSAELAAAADFRPGFLSCACAPCAPEVRAGPAESETGSPLILSQAALVGFDGEKATALGQRLSQDYLDRVRDPERGLSVAEAQRELEEVILKALRDETTDVETVLGLKEALNIFNEKHQDADVSRGPGPTYARRVEVSNAIAL